MRESRTYRAPGWNILQEHATVGVQARRNSHHLARAPLVLRRSSDMAGHERGQLHHRRGSAAPLSINRVLREDARKARQVVSPGLDATAACRCARAPLPWLVLPGQCCEYRIAWQNALVYVKCAIEAVASQATRDRRRASLHKRAVHKSGVSLLKAIRFAI